MKVEYLFAIGHKDSELEIKAFDFSVLRRVCIRERAPFN
jgi:hypothetical protein